MTTLYLVQEIAHHIIVTWKRSSVLPVVLGTNCDVDMGTGEFQMRGLNRPAETVLDRGTRTSPSTDSTEHLDVDVLVTTPCVQQAEQVADAADAQ